MIQGHIINPGAIPDHAARDHSDLNAQLPMKPELSKGSNRSHRPCSPAHLAVGDKRCRRDAVQCFQALEHLVQLLQLPLALGEL